MTHSDGQGGNGGDGALERRILEALEAMDRRLERLERTVERLAGPYADPAVGSYDEASVGPAGEVRPVAPDRREPTLGRPVREADPDHVAAPGGGAGHENDDYEADDEPEHDHDHEREGDRADRPASDGGEDRGTRREGESVLAPGRDLPPPPQVKRERSGARGVITFLIAVALLGGGVYWLSQNLDWRESLPPEWLGGEAEEAGAPAGRQRNAGAGEPAGEDAAGGDGADGGGRGDLDAPDATGAGRADAASGDGGNDGASGERGAPEMPAVPRRPVETVETVETVEVGEGLTPLPDDASEELQALAEDARDGDPQAQHDLALRYALGDGLPQNRDRAAFWFEMAADAGVANAVYNLGVLTQRGEGVSQDSRAAVRLFRRAAEDGHPQAQFALGLAYSQGRGVDRDLREAASWFQAASANDFPRGAYYLGRLYEQGFDGDPDLSAAAGWYRIAADAGEEDAAEALDRLTDAGAEPASRQTLTAAVPVPETTPEPVAPGGGTGDADGANDGLSQAQMREVQQRLEALGYDPGPVDGLMGARTEAAIAAFQEDRGLEADGEATPQLLERLREAEPSG